MGITRKPTKVNGSMPVFWRGECKVLPGDIELNSSIPDGTTLLKGTPVHIDFTSSNSHYLCATALIVSGGTTAAPRVAKGHTFAPGMMVYIGEATGIISAIDTSNAEYDVFAMKAAVTGAVAGAIMTASTSVPNAVIAETKTIDSTRGFKGVAVSYDAVVLSGSIPRLPEAWVTEGGLCLKNNHSIKFIKQ